jgi:3-methyladenine DNA glycosylase AlkD
MPSDDPLAIAEMISTALGAHADPVRAAGARRYLKSELEFIGVTAAVLRRTVREALRGVALDRSTLHALLQRLWSPGVFELRVAAMEVLVVRVRGLEAQDLEFIEGFIRDSHTWALVDGFAAWVVGPIVERHPEAVAILDRWAGDDDFWVRRAAMLALLLPLRRGGGDFERFARYADAMIGEKEFFIRKAIGWILREVGKKRPRLVAEWLTPRAARASGLTVREAIKYLPAELREAVLAAHQAGRKRDRVTPGAS